MQERVEVPWADVDWFPYVTPANPESASLAEQVSVTVPPMYQPRRPGAPPESEATSTGGVESTL